MKTEPVTAVAVSITDDPVTMFAEHTLPQFIPPMSLVTLPDPAPPFVTATA